MESKYPIDLDTLIADAHVGEWLDIASYSQRYRRVKFDFDEGYGYTWMADVVGSLLMAMPLVSSNRVKFFKTLAGAKRNFLRMEKR